MNKVIYNPGQDEFLLEVMTDGGPQRFPIRREQTKFQPRHYVEIGGGRQYLTDTEEDELESIMAII